MACDPHAGGPANTLDDTPLGLSSGMVGDIGGEAVAVRNNGAEPFWVPRLFFGPPWADVQLGPTPEALPESTPDIASHHTVAPKDTKVLHVRMSVARPVSSEKSTWLAGQQIVICSSPFTGVCLFFALVGLVTLLAFHLAVTISAAANPEASYWWPSVTFGIAVGYSAFLSPGWLRGFWLFVLDTLFSQIDRLLPTTRPIASAYNWLNAPDVGNGGRLFRLALLTVLATAAVTLLHRALPSWATVSLMSNATGSVFAFIGVGLLYGFVLLLLWSWWLAKFGLFDWLWNGLTRRVKSFGPVPGVAVPVSAPVPPRP